MLVTFELFVYIIFDKIADLQKLLFLILGIFFSTNFTQTIFIKTGAETSNMLAYSLKI